MRAHVASGLLVASLGLAACGSSGSPQQPIPPTPTPTATATATPTVAATEATASGFRVQGDVVDFDTDAPLGDVPVALAAIDGKGAGYAPVAQTGPDGHFAFYAAAGTYVLAVGSNASSDTTRATLHQQLTVAGAPVNVLAPVPSPVPDVTVAPSQTSGDLRLARLSAGEARCIGTTNAGRTAGGLKPLVADEIGLEAARAVAAEQVAANVSDPSSGGAAFFTYLPVLGIVGAYTTGGSCLPGGPPVYVPVIVGTNPFTSATWYAGEVNPQASSSPAAYLMNEILMADPSAAS